MKTKYVLLGMAAAVAIGMLLAPRKGSDTRKLILKMPESFWDTMKYRFYQVSDKFSKAKDEATDEAKKVLYKTHSVVNEAKAYFILNYHTKLRNDRPAIIPQFNFMRRKLYIHKYYLYVL